MKSAFMLKTLLAFVVLSISQAIFAPSAEAGDRVLRCDNCTRAVWNPQVKAGGPGYVYLIDYHNVTLRFFDVHYDSGILVALPTPPPASAASMFAQVADMRSRDTSKVTFFISPTSPMLLGNNAMSGFEGADAYDVVGNANVRAGMGRLIAGAVNANTGNATWDNLTYTLGSIIMGAGSFFSMSEAIVFNVVVTWSDGSTSTFELKGDSITEAKYVLGSSRTAEGLPLPDASVNTAEGFDAFVGDFVFESPVSASEWVDAMRLQGVEVTGPQTSQLRCTWDGQTLKCSYT